MSADSNIETLRFLALKEAIAKFDTIEDIMEGAEKFLGFLRGPVIVRGDCPLPVDLTPGGIKVTVDLKEQSEQQGGVDAPIRRHVYREGPL